MRGNWPSLAKMPHKQNVWNCEAPIHPSRAMALQMRYNCEMKNTTTTEKELTWEALESLLNSSSRIPCRSTFQKPPWAFTIREYATATGMSIPGSTSALRRGLSEGVLRVRDCRVGRHIAKLYEPLVQAPKKGSKTKLTSSRPQQPSRSAGQKKTRKGKPGECAPVAKRKAKPAPARAKRKSSFVRQP